MEPRRSAGRRRGPAVPRSFDEAGVREPAHDHGPQRTSTPTAGGHGHGTVFVAVFDSAVIDDVDALPRVSTRAEAERQAGVDEALSPRPATLSRRPGDACPAETGDTYRPRTGGSSKRTRGRLQGWEQYCDGRVYELRRGRDWTDDVSAESKRLAFRQWCAPPRLAW